MDAGPRGCVRPPCSVVLLRPRGVLWGACTLSPPRHDRRGMRPETRQVIPSQAAIVSVHILVECVQMEANVSSEERAAGVYVEAA